MATRIPTPLSVGLLLGTLLFPTWADAQIQLQQPDIAFPEDFGTIQTVRELPNGKVLVADPLAKALYLVDLEAGTREQIGREGQGPEEYGQPDAVWPLPGDSTLLVDLGNGRLVAMGPDLSFGPTQPIMVGEFSPGSPLVLALPVGVDGRGRIYTRSMGGMEPGAFPDSADILRIDRTNRTSEEVAKVKIRSVTQETSGGANNQRVAISPIPLSPEDAWGVAPDGSIVVARAGDYHLERIGSDGSVTRGPAIPFEAVGIGTAEKEEYLAEQGRSGGGVQVGVTVDNGQMAMSFGRGGQTEAQQISQYTWPEDKAPIYAGRIPVDLQGRAWVRRHVEAGEESTYDVFDAAGHRIETILLPHGNRILGFGDGTIYVVAYDEFDLNYLQRYAMPGF